MTVKELKELLNQIEDENLLVVTYSGESGFDEVAEPEIIYIKLGHNSGQSWNGLHARGNFEQDTKAVLI